MHSCPKLLLEYYYGWYFKDWLPVWVNYINYTLTNVQHPTSWRTSSHEQPYVAELAIMISEALKILRTRSHYHPCFMDIGTRMHRSRLKWPLLSS
jgi:hypothetical protein